MSQNVPWRTKCERKEGGREAGREGEKDKERKGRRGLERERDREDSSSHRHNKSAPTYWIFIIYVQRKLFRPVLHFSWAE